MEKCLLNDESYWDTICNPSFDESILAASNQPDDLYRGVIDHTKLSALIQKLYEDSSFQDKSIPLCYYCLGKCMNDIQKQYKRFQSDAHSLQKFEEFIVNNSIEFPNVDNEKETVNRIDVTDLNFLQQEYVNMNEYMLSCVKKSDLLDQEIENELNEIKNLEYDITNINESIDESNNSLNSIFSEIEYLEKMNSTKITYSSFCQLIQQSDGIFSVNGFRLSFDTVPTINLNWPEINAAWSNLALAALVVQYDAKQKHVNSFDSIRFTIKPLQSVTFIYDQNKAYIIEGSGRAISNRNYVQGILAFAVYVKDLCNLLLPSVNHPLAKAPVEKMLGSIYGIGAVEETHMKAVVHATIQSIKLFDIDEY